MVALIDYECNVCGNDPEYVDHCLTCDGTGGLRLPAGCNVQAVERELVVTDTGLLAEAKAAFEVWFEETFGYFTTDDPATASLYEAAFTAGYLDRS